MSSFPTIEGSNAALLSELRSKLAHHKKLVVAFSGGADSALLAYAATAELGASNVLCATAVSASLAESDRRETEALAVEWGLRYRTVGTAELDNPAYQANNLDRCFYCKSALMDVLGPIAKDEGADVALGVNVDDLGEHRPGQAAALEGGAVFPLLEAGLRKEQVRSLSKALGLRTWDKPANACLSSRIPQGTTVTISLLSKVERAEAAVRDLGFSELRVRHYGETCRIELNEDDIERAVQARAAIVHALKAVGYRYVTLDLEVLRSGNLVRTAIETGRS